ncbi:hypothetical protein [Acidomonas methanolica]|uniref:hypothetical protein n=1 Tax=Acidomonas methanolica TaxID=437 RepID=UPI002119F93C|nr:hypothetical protein [Acidomonas methanolica]MCQ9156764.1 hypothetical protein [Acidomonas methanolica]
MTALPPAISLDSLAPAERIALCRIRALMGRVMHGKSDTWKGARRKFREALDIAALSAFRRLPVLIALRDKRQGQGTQNNPYRRRAPASRHPQCHDRERSAFADHMINTGAPA